MFSHPQRKAWGIFLAFVVVSAAIYAPAFDNSFRDDDFAFLRASILSHSPVNLVEHIPHFTFYRPGALLLFWVEYHVFGLRHPGAYIGLNLFIHVLSTLLLVALLVRMKIGLPAACLAGGLFAVGFGHYGKEVLWACTGGGLLAVLMVLAVLWLTATYVQTPAASRASQRLRILAAGGLMLLAPTFHEMGLMAPVLVVTLVWALHGRTGTGAGRVTGRIDRSILISVALPLLVWIPAYAFLQTTHEAYHHSPEAIPAMPSALVRYLGLMVIPIKGSTLIPGQPPLVRWLLSVSHVLHRVVGITMLALSALLLLLGSRTTKFLVVWLYVALLPFCLVGVPEQWLELRYVYFAAAPLCALFASGLAGLGRRRRSAAIALVVLAGFMAAYVTSTLERKYDAQGLEPLNQQRLHQSIEMRNAVKGGAG